MASSGRAHRMKTLQKPREVAQHSQIRVDRVRVEVHDVVPDGKDDGASCVPIEYLAAPGLFAECLLDRALVSASGQADGSRQA